MWDSGRYYDPPIGGGGGGEDINLPFIIGLSSSLSFVLLVVLILAIYYIFFNDGQSSGEFLSGTLHIPDSFSNMDDTLENESVYLDKLSDTDQFYYRMGKRFQDRHKPQLTPMGQAMDLNVQLRITNRGIHCFYFEPYTDQLADLSRDDDAETTPLIDNQLTHTTYGALVRSDIPYIVEDKRDITFLTANPASTILNLPLPTKNRHNDTVYFEVKLFELDTDTTRISLGLSTKPNPNFRLPGEYYYSFGLESTGNLKINRPLATAEHTPVLTPQLIQGDVIGIGFKSITGTIFITHNGKKIADIIKNLKMDLYPCIGSVGGPSKVQVNLGQSGFVFIEANVKKLGFCESNNEGNLGAPPVYDRVVKKEKARRNNNVADDDADDSSSTDIVLERGEALPPEYPEDENTFFGPSALLVTHNNNNVVPGSAPSKPPSYRSNSPSSGDSDGSAKISRIVSTKLNRQQQIPDKLLDLNQRFYEHSTSQFDRSENVGADGDFEISQANIEDLIGEESSSAPAARLPSTVAKEAQEGSSSGQVALKDPSPAPSAGSNVSASKKKPNKKKKKRHSKKTRK